MLNETNRHLLGKPSLMSDHCCVCGKPATNNHHVIQKGMGGTKRKDIPTLPLCGMGNTSGCHGKAHSGQLHFDFKEGYGWVYCETEPCSYLEALETGEWWPCR